MRRKKAAFPVIPLTTRERGANIATPTRKKRKKTRKTNMATMNMTMKKTTTNTTKTNMPTMNTKKTMNIATKNAKITPTDGKQGAFYSIPQMLIAAEAVSGITMILMSVAVTKVVAASAVSPLKRVLIATTEAAGDIAMDIIGARKA